jgi:hypothetical protein
MKTLMNHVILYDADCPMCNLYTSAFVKMEMLDENGREPYQNTPAELCPLIDRQRSVDEIALVNRATGEVTYGISSLFQIMSNAWPVFKPLFGFKPFMTIMSKLYTFISANRKVMIPVKVVSDTIQPTFKLKYRLAYLLLTWLITSIILTEYARILTPLVPLGKVYREYIICGGQIMVQYVIAGLVNKRKQWDYLGNMMTVSFAGSLLLLPMLLTARMIPLNTLVIIAYFMAVAGCMLLEHARRTTLLQLGWTLTVSWVLYRVMVLLLILNTVI